jgi:cytochrome c peroxidase
MFGDDPVELGMVGKEDLLIQRLKSEPRYGKLFADAYPDLQEQFTLANITKAIASFERTILSGDSPYDVYRRGDDPNAISASAKRGEALFFSERLECFHCHGGFNFTGSVDYYGKGFAEVEFHNTGLYNLTGKFSYPEPNLGLYTFTEAPDDVGKFKAPTLRNVAVTAPYMHDGSIKTLEEAIDHYAAGGRTVKNGVLAGDGSKNPNKSEFVKGFELTPTDKADLLDFLRSLTDSSLLTNPALSDPWNKRAAAGLTVSTQGKVLTGQVVEVFPGDGTITLYHDEVPGMMGPMKPPYTMEFILSDKTATARLTPGMKIKATVQRQGRDFVLSGVVPARP